MAQNQANLLDPICSIGYPRPILALSVSADASRYNLWERFGNLTDELSNLTFALFHCQFISQIVWQGSVSDDQQFNLGYRTPEPECLFSRQHSFGMPIGTRKASRCLRIRGLIRILLKATWSLLTRQAEGGSEGRIGFGCRSIQARMSQGIQCSVSRPIFPTIDEREDFNIVARWWSSLASAYWVLLSLMTFAWWMRPANFFSALITWTWRFSMRAARVSTSRMLSGIWFLIIK